MRVTDLDLRELFAYDPQGGILRFAGQRALLFDAVALGLLRRELIETVGLTAARGILTRFGYAHGWRTAETLRTAFDWDSDDEWRRAGGRLHRLQGLVEFEPVTRPHARRPFADAVWRSSYEAEQHLLHVGRSDEPVCWTLTGFASGYLSYSHGTPILCVEDRCRGRGDAVCTMVGRPREEWGEDAARLLAFYEKDCLDASLRRVTETLKHTEAKLRSRRRALERAGHDADDDGIVARSAAMKHVLDLARRVAQVDSTVLVTGESGVGKEVVARLVHDRSARAAQPFFAINCAAVPETLLESELFGHVRGAFTGASQDRPGMFEAADRSTIFLDEIGDVPLAMQAKLLRVLQQREVRRVGENRARPVDVRVVAATNRDLAEDVENGRFRRDLYYRLRVVELVIPPLRARPEDVLPLARRFLAESAARLGRKVTGLSPEAAALLGRYPFPGNVRELENAMERAVVLARGARVTEEDLPDELRARSPARPGAVRPLADVERDAILGAVEASAGNKAKAAAALGIGTATLFRKLARYAEEDRAARRAPKARVRLSPTRTGR